MSVDNGNLSIRLPIAAEVFTSPFPYNLTSASLEDITTVAPTNSTVLPELDYIYTFTEIVVAIVAVIGNALTITVFAVDRKLRRLTNYYIVALAVADLLVGVLGIPFAILTSIGLPKPLWPCLLMLSTLLVLCTTSIFCLVAVSVDRYWAILHPLRYSRVMTARIARYIILMCWVAGTCIGLLPLMGWHKEYKNECYFVEVMDYRYLVFLYFATIVGPGILMAVFYAHIYTVVLKQLRQIAAHEPQAESGSLAGQSSQRQRPRFLMSRSQSRQMGDMSRLDSRRSSTTTNIVSQVTHPSRREVKAARSLSIIVLFFMFCWFPLYTINFFQYVCPNCAVPGIVMHMTIILSHLNSAINPLLYAYHMKDFRMAIKMFILHRILRRPLPADYVFNRSLVSPHHSTLYRVTVGGAASQNMNLHTPHAHNTPMTGSPSPLVGTPKGGQRSRTSTLGSSGPWPPSRGLSPSPSSPRNPPITPLNAVSHPSSLLRPRAATITTHTAPASALKPGSPVKPGSPPEIRSGPKLLEASQRRQVTTLPSDILMAVTEGLSSNVNASRPDTAHSQSDDNLVKVSVTKPKEDVHASPNPGSDTTASNPDEKAEESSVMPKEQVMSEQPETKSQCEETIKKEIPSESIQKTESTKPQACQEGKSDPLTEDILKRDSEEESDPIEFITPPLPNGSACSGQEESESQNHQAEEPSPRREELKSLFESSAQSTKPPPREDVLDSRTAGQKLGESRFPRELYKYIPKILRRRQGTLKTKSSKNTKSWWPELMKQRSYHDLSGVKSSEQVRRTWSACSAMDG